VETFNGNMQISFIFISIITISLIFYFDSTCGKFILKGAFNFFFLRKKGAFNVLFHIHTKILKGIFKD